MNQQERSLWLEKYRPNNLDDVKGQDKIINSIKRYVENGELPNFLFSGPPGVGKTATAVAIAREIYGEEWEDYFLELNASDDRGIDVIRDNVKNFARTSTGSVEFRIIFLDEADALTSDAQSALRRTMEQLSSNVRFILSCNYPSQIIAPIQSRCTINRFKSLSDSAIREQILEIADSEDLDITDDAISAIIYTSNGDMRRAINTLQSVSMFNNEITEDMVYDKTNSIRPEEIENILYTALKGDFIKSRNTTREFMNERGVVSTELLEQFHRAIWDDMDLDSETAVEISDTLGKVDYRITQGANEKIQLDSFLSKISELD